MNLHEPGPFLLATDLDDTLLGDAEGESQLKAFMAGRHGRFRLAYVTGRRASWVRELVKAGRLPAPDYVCADVGTEIVAWDDPEDPIGRSYAARVAPTWDLEAIYALGAGDGVGRQDFSGGQTPFRACFSWDGRDKTLEALRQRLSDRPGIRIVPSYGVSIDVLPAGLGKGEAVRFLQRELGLDPLQVVVAGDAGNDVEMFQTGFKGILPSNARDELRVFARQPWHYHSPLPGARGVLDGLQHFGFTPPFPGEMSRFRR